MARRKRITASGLLKEISSVQKYGKDYKIIEREFDSVAEYAEYVGIAEIKNAADGGSHMAKLGHFHDAESWEDAMNNVKNGVSERVTAVMDAASAVKKEIEQVTYKKKHDVAGSYLDIGRYLDGEPECFVRRMRSKQERKVVTIGVNANASCGVSATQIKNRGGAIVALIDNLLDAGVIVDLVLDIQMDNRDEKIAVTDYITYNASNMDMDAVAYALTSADFLRRFGFASLELAMHDAGIEDVVQKCKNDAYGSAVKGYPAGKQYDIYCPAVISENHKLFDTAESSARWVTNLIERYNAGEEEMIVA